MNKIVGVEIQPIVHNPHPPDKHPNTIERNDLICLKAHSYAVKSDKESNEMDKTPIDF